MPPAVVAAGVIGAASIGGALISSGAQSSAANQANQAQQSATNAQLQLGQQSLALNQDIYNSNYNTLSPWVSRGNVAGDAYSALLGLPAAPAMTSPLQAAPTASGGASVGASAPPPVASNASPTPATSWSSMTRVPSPTGTAAMTPIGLAINALTPPATRPAVGAPAPGATPTPTPAPTTRPATTPTATPASAMQNFANSAGMQFQLKQGANAINNLYAAHGQLQSGAAAKAIQSYGQNTALQNYFMPYMSMVNGVSQQGLGSGSAIAGVGSSFGNTAAGINGQMGNAYQNGADSAANAAIARGYGQAQLWNTVGNQVGNIASSYVPTGSSGFNAATSPIYGAPLY